MVDKPKLSLLSKERERTAAIMRSDVICRPVTDP